MHYSQTGTRRLLAQLAFNKIPRGKLFKPHCKLMSLTCLPGMSKVLVSLYSFKMKKKQLNLQTGNYFSFVFEVCGLSWFDPNNLMRFVFCNSNTMWPCVMIQCDCVKASSNSWTSEICLLNVQYYFNRQNFIWVCNSNLAFLIEAEIFFNFVCSCGIMVYFYWGKNTQRTLEMITILINN